MMDPERHITLRELQQLVRQTLDERFALPLWVSAEISEIKVNYSGHCYLELVEKGGDNGVPTAQARAVIWRSNYPRIAGYFEAETGQRLEAGIRILARVLVNYHELYGFSLQITDIDPSYSLGDMERQRQMTIAQLQRDGVWEMNREQPMPPSYSAWPSSRAPMPPVTRTSARSSGRAPTAFTSRCSTPSCRGRGRGVDHRGALLRGRTPRGVRRRGADPRRRIA